MSKQSKNNEPDSVFFLKILFFFILGSVWIVFQNSGDAQKVIPVGLALGLFFAHHDHFMIDRKIEYAVLLASAILSYVSPLGIVILL